LIVELSDCTGLIIVFQFQNISNSGEILQDNCFNVAVSLF